VQYGTLADLFPRSPSDYADDLDIELAVRLRQSKVTNFQCYITEYCCLPSSSWENVAPGFDELANITSLQIFTPGWPELLRRPSWIYARTPALLNLDLELETCNLGGDEDCCPHGLDVVNRLFGPHDTTRQAPKLKSLRITRMCLMLAGNALPQLMNLEELEHLQLVRCTDIDPFLRNLAALRLNLSSLCLKNFHRDDAPFFAVNDFIRSLAPLKRITLKWGGICLLDELCLQQHASSVESLRIEDTTPTESPFMPYSEHAPKLEQLALSGFTTEVENWPTSWRSSLWFRVRPLQKVSKRLGELANNVAWTNHILG
jgi:hypothetical protein